MAMQICVLCDHLLELAAWQEAVDAAKLPLRLLEAEPERNLAARLGDEKTGIEYDVHDFSDLRNAYEQLNCERNWKYAISFTWSSDLVEEIAAWMAAAAYACATNGIIFDEQEGKLFTPEESLGIAADTEKRRPRIEAMLRDYIEQLSPTSPAAEMELRAFLGRRLRQSNRT